MIPLVEYWDHISLTLLGHLLRSADDDPLRNITFTHPFPTPLLYNFRRTGRPRQHWTVETVNLAWRRYVTPDHPHLPGYDPTDPHHRALLLTAAHDRRF